MLESEKRRWSVYQENLSEFKTKEAELKAEMEKLSNERSKVQEQYIRDRMQVAVVLSDKLFRQIYQGDIAEMFTTLRDAVKEIAAADPKAELKLSTPDKDGGVYGLKGGDAQQFFVQFVFSSIMADRGLADILERTKRHGDNPYLAKPPAVEPKAPAKEAKK
jgi:hypothetical protein